MLIEYGYKKCVTVCTDNIPNNSINKWKKFIAVTVNGT